MSNVNRQLSNVRRRGFSFVEVVIAVFVMLVGIVAVLKLVSSNFIHSADSRDTIIAAELAQEGVELVRNIRDNNLAKDAAGGAFYNFDKSVSFDECTIDKDYVYNDPPTSPTNFNCAPTSSSYQLYNNNTNYYYVHLATGATLTKFQRKIIINWDHYVLSPPVFDQMTVKSIVIWGRSANDFPASCTIGNKCVMTDVVLGERK